ncbi:MATE family efflux transporter [Clostridium hydrogeniformans]|uniref:MATE family efflux transporter n=1 Tax=Clostridium hydrogeniformans TaxID=349933 RepID=UPI000480FC31|nr:MATE family efflux transporter [Clostridium hydrogeniformans]
MEKRIDLTEGHITSKLVKLALPIMGTSFIQMAYNMTDMIWIGRVGSSAVAAVGTAGFFTWLAMAFIMISKVGAEIKVSQSLGRHDQEAARKYVVSAIQINIVLAIIYGVVVFIFRKPFLDFFKLGDPEVIAMAETYLVVMVIGMVFYFINPVFTAIFNGAGSSRTPFLINTIGLIFNIIFDPVLIMGIGPFPKMGVLGAAIATIMAQAIVSFCFIVVMLKSKEKFLKVSIFSKPDIEHIKVICKLGFPVGCQNGLFTIFSMFIARIIAGWGPVAIAVQKVGSQIEAISWMTAGGFSTALGAFVGQNYGAKKHDRILKGYKATMGMAVVVGVLSTILLVFAGETIFSFFIPEAEAIKYGQVYLRILGYSQLFMCIEITTAGAFNGLGKTYIPSIISVILTGSRIPAAYLLSSISSLGLDGVWWSISISSIAKGVIMTATFLVLLKINKLFNDEKHLEKVS